MVLCKIKQFNKTHKHTVAACCRQVSFSYTGTRINIGIKHGFPCINICQVPRKVLTSEVEDGDQIRYSTVKVQMEPPPLSLNR